MRGFGVKDIHTMENSSLFDRAVALLNSIPHLSFEGMLGSHLCYGFDGEVYPIPLSDLPNFVPALEATAKDCGVSK